MVFDSRIQLRDPWNTAYNRKRKQEHFWLIFTEGPLSCWRGISQKTIPVTYVTVQMFTMSVNSLKLSILYVTSNELFIYYSYQW